MGLLSKGWGWLRRPLVLAPTSAALGAGVAICIFGIPELWTPEAAGWASAAGALFAGVVALYVGITPERLRRQGAQKRAHAFLQWAERALAMQSVHLASAIRQMEVEVLQDGDIAKVVHELSVLDPAPIRRLADFFDAMAPALVGEVARCATDMDTAIQMTSTLRRVPRHQGVDITDSRREFQCLLCSMEDARRNIAMAVYGNEGTCPAMAEVQIARRAMSLGND